MRGIAPHIAPHIAALRIGSKGFAGFSSRIKRAW